LVFFRASLAKWTGKAVVDGIEKEQSARSKNSPDFLVEPLTVSPVKMSDKAEAVGQIELLGEREPECVSSHPNDLTGSLSPLFYHRVIKLQADKLAIRSDVPRDPPRSRGDFENPLGSSLIDRPLHCINLSLV